MTANNITVITTSWDDGHPLDLRVAELLASYGMKGTFYVPINYALVPRMSCNEIVELRRMGMEIGSHTQNHPRIHKLDEEAVLRELRDSKAYLEDLLGEQITAFCYPEGKFTAQQLPLLRQAGYKLARTTVGFRTNLNFNPYLMPVGFQLWPHSRHTLLQHALVQKNLRGIADWTRLWGAEYELDRLADCMLQHILKAGGVLHLWGHSWEVDQGRLWTELDRILRKVADCGNVLPLTNSEVLEAAAHSATQPKNVYA